MAKLTRAALLPTPGDPFLLAYWYSIYKFVWADEIDRLYVHVNGQAEPQVLRYIRDLFKGDEKVTYIESDVQQDHGGAILKMLNECEEDLIMLVEDDAFVFASEKVDRCFKLIEDGSYDIVGCKRGSCSSEILKKAANKWGLDYSGYGDTGCNFWPNFFFTRREILLKTDCNFNAKRWEAGDMIDGIDEIAEDVCVGDTFVNTSLQLQGLIPQERIWYENQYHGATDDAEDWSNRTNIWSPECFWFHVGSLSSGVFGLLDLDRELPKGVFQSEQEKLELERRVCFWLIFSNFYEGGTIDEYHRKYKEAIRRLIEYYELDPNRIAKRKTMYREVLPQWT